MIEKCQLLSHHWIASTRTRRLLIRCILQPSWIYKQHYTLRKLYKYWFYTFSTRHAFYILIVLNLCPRSSFSWPMTVQYRLSRELLNNRWNGKMCELKPKPNFQQPMNNKYKLLQIYWWNPSAKMLCILGATHMDRHRRTNAERFPTP